MNARRVVVIGGGPGGYVAAIRAAQLGAEVILVERDKIGGTCLNRGCIPTKALLSDAKLLRLLKRSPIFQSPPLQECHPLKSMMERKNKVVQELVKGVEVLLESQRVAVKHAEADLSGPNQVVLSNGAEKKEIIRADAIILALGSTSKPLPNIVPDGKTIITSDEALEIKKVPTDIAIIGGGYIGVEFATLFNALGSKVTIIEILENILPGLDGELSRNLKRSFETDGIRILTRSSLKEIHPQGEGLRLTVETPQGLQTADAEKLLLAVGRIPDLNLDLSKANVAIFSHGIQVNRRMETSTPTIYAIGDVIGGVQLAHVAMEEGIVAAENAVGMDRELEDTLIPLCIFTYPEIASIGLTENEARRRGRIKVGRFPFRSNPKAVISGETEGLIKVVASGETNEILGAHIIGLDASDIVSIVACLMRQGTKIAEFSKFIQAHPTVTEALKEAVLDADGTAIHLPKTLGKMKK